MAGECRFCGTPLSRSFLNLGMSPLSNAYLTSEQLHETEPFYPLHAYVCEECFLVQLEEFAPPERLFSDYAYFSSYSDTWLQHAQAYAEQMMKRRLLDTRTRVVEIASNDGYLLKHFQKKGVHILGIEPAQNVAEVAIEAGVPTRIAFFNAALASELTGEGNGADLIVANNVLAHVPDLNSFVEGLRILMNERGTITIEFPHLLQLILKNQFDTIYHEHFSYFSMLAVKRIFQHHRLTLFDVEELRSHGGSLRIYARHNDEIDRKVSVNVDRVLENEMRAGLNNLETYAAFSEQVTKTKHKFLEFLISAKQEGKTIVGYGAPAKGNTLLNYSGIGVDFIDYTVDRNPHKQGRYLPGTHIPIRSPDRIREDRPDYLLILPWNLRDEIQGQMAYIREWGGQFVVPIPQIEVFT